MMEINTQGGWLRLLPHAEEVADIKRFALSPKGIRCFLAKRCVALAFAFRDNQHALCCRIFRGRSSILCAHLHPKLKLIDITRAKGIGACCTSAASIVASLDWVRCKLV